MFLFTNYKHVHFFQFNNEAATNGVIIFFKLRPEPVTASNLHSNVLISSMPDPVNGLYHLLQKVNMIGSYF